MSGQVRAEKRQRERPQSESEPVEAKNQQAEGERLKAEMDDLLDEIDGVLEENAEDFIRDFVQKGGEAVRVMLEPLRTPVRMRVALT